MRWHRENASLRYSVVFTSTYDISSEDFQKDAYITTVAQAANVPEESVDAIVDHEQLQHISIVPIHVDTVVYRRV